MHPLPIFVGYDKAEPVAYHTCCESIITNSSKPVSITPLYIPQLKEIYSGEQKHQEGYPPSNGFIFSRFLVPFLSGYKGLALFIDGDMVVEGDVAELFENFNPRMAVEVVKHDYKTTANRKYLGAVNLDYPRKNWSSVIMWNCGSAINQKLTPEVVQNATGEYLHRFKWIEDERIGSLPKQWNYLADEPNQEGPPKLIHYTLGTPCWKEYAKSEYAGLWHWHHAGMNNYAGKDTGL